MVHQELANRRFTELQKVFAAGKASHAYLFVGQLNPDNEDGIKRLAQTILCLSTDGKPCGHCRSCQLLLRDSHPDFRVIEPEEGKIKLEEVRQICYDTVLNPYLSPCKVYLFKGFETLTEVAANAFLKTLEEPPPAVYFLAQAEQELGVLPTVRSRMQRIQLGNEAPAGEGSPVNDLPIHDLYALLRQAEVLGRQDRNQVALFLQGLQAYFRGQMLAEVKTGAAHKGLVAVIAAIQQARAYTAANLNLRLLLEDLFLTVYEELGPDPGIKKLNSY